MDTSQITVENVAAVIGVGIVSAWLAARKYLAQLKAPPPSVSSDVIVAGAALADMGPIRDLVETQKGLVAQQKRIADSLDLIYAILHARQLADAAADEDELRDRIRDLERSLADAGRVPDPRRRR
jgi:hypothetical protein